MVGVNQWALAFAITAENFTSAIGTVIFVAYLSALCRNPLHTATQYALLTALAAVGRTYLSSGAGYVAKATGWPLFFAICVAGRDAEPDPAGVAAAARTFRGAGTGEGLSLAGGIDPRSSGSLETPVDAPECFVTTLHLVTTASLICPASCGTGDLVDLQRDFLADETLQLRDLGVAAGDDLECFGPGFQIAQPARRRQPARLAGELIGRRRACPSCRCGRAWR